MEDASVMGVILAAGEGVRMLPLSAQIPKPLLPVSNRPLIAHHLAALRGAGIRDVLVVVGRRRAELEGELGDGSAHGVRIRYVEQERPRGIAHAVGVVEPFVDRPFLLVLGDVFFVPKNLEAMPKLLDEGNDAVLAAVDGAPLEAIRRNFAILLADDGSVARVIEKPRHPPTRLRGCGVYLFDPSFFDAIRRTPRSVLRDEYEITDAIQIFVDDGRRVAVADVLTDDVNITYPRDVWELNLRELSRSGKTAEIDESATLDPAAEIVDAVIGPEARVAACRVRRSVVFSGARVDEDVDDALVTRDGRVAFGEEG